MDFLDKLVLPQSAEHIELLHYMLTLVLALFVPFISIIFGGTFASIHFGKKFRKTKTLYYKKFSKDVIEYVTVNNGVGVILGIVPLLAAMLIFAQLLHTAEIQTVSFIALSLVLIIVALFMIYTYRYSMVLSNVFESVNSDAITDRDTEEDYKKIKEKSSYLSLKYGKSGLVFLFIGIWFYVAAITSATTFTSWNFNGLITSLAAPKVLLNLLIFVAFAFTLTNAAILFIHLYWKDSKKDEDVLYTKFVKDTASKAGLKSSIVLPVLIAINLFSFPETNLSGSIFVYAVVSILLIFLAYHFFYMIQIKNDYRFGSLIFFVLILAMVSFLIKDQKAMTSATEKHSLVLSTEYDRILAELKGEGTVAVLSGKEIYDVRCASCHKFDQKLVGPAHNDVLPKYVGKEAQLVAFIRNPVKVDPAYPPMPNPGLKPQEADAVAKYLLEEFAKQK
ncbi:MAG: c-type cytochrome [Ignavibacterium sp.]|jgi:cytochrome c|nr:c-type cytochrome [Ignavibacterium sp.]